jgi:hypothetical protein
MINIELKLLSTMLYKGDFAPMLNNDVSADDFNTDSGKALYQFIANFRTSGGKHKFPTLSIIRSRFDSASMDLPEPDPSDTVEQLVSEIQLRRRRQAIAELSTELDDLAQDPDDPSEKLGTLLSKMRRIVTKDNSVRVATLADSIGKIRDDYESGLLMPNGRPWPWPSLTKATRGIHDKEFVFMAGRPKSKKTFLALKVCVNELFTGGTTLVFSPEMRSEQIMVRVVALLAEVVYHEFKDANLDDAQARRLLSLADTFSRHGKETDKQYRIRLRKSLGLPKGGRPSLIVIESAGRNLSWMEAQIELHRPTLVLADSLYRQSPDQDKGNDAGWKAFTATMRGTKNMSMNTGVPIFATHQINRAGHDNVGGLENLALGDAAGQEADLVLRAVSGSIENRPMTALIPLGGREIEVDAGILINSALCTDFSEVGTVVNRDIIKQLMKRELDEETGVEPAGKAKGPVSSPKTEEMRRKASAMVKKQAKNVNKVLASQVDEADI